MLIKHKKLPPMQCYHIFSNSMVVYLARNHYGSYSPEIVLTNPPGAWPRAYKSGNEFSCSPLYFVKYK